MQLFLEEGARWQVLVAYMASPAPVRHAGGEQEPTPVTITRRRAGLGLFPSD
ncbi:hypothetical protein ACFQ2B_16790 [Streptomyces stramineus]